MTNANVSAVATQALVSGSPNAQVEAAALQVLASGTPLAQVEAVALQVLAEVVVGATEVAGVAATVAAAAPVGAVSAASVVIDASLAGVAAPVAATAPDGALSIVSGGSISLTGEAATVSAMAPAGSVIAGSPVALTGVKSSVAAAAPAGTVTLGQAIVGPPARVSITAIPGTVFVGTPPSVVEAVRVTPGSTGTTFTVPFTEAVQPGDVAVISYIGDISPFGSRVASFSVSGLDGTWDRTPSDPLNIRTQSIFAISTDITTTGNVTVTVDGNFDPLLIGMLIRGTNGRVELPSGSSQVYRNSGIGEIVIAAATVDVSWQGTPLDVVNYMARPSESAWTETTSYTAKSGLERQVVFAAPQYADVYGLFPYYTMGGGKYELASLVIGQAEVDVVATSAPAAVSIKAPAGDVLAEVVFPPLKGGGVLQSTSLTTVSPVVMAATDLTGGGALTTGAVVPVTPQTQTTLAGGGTIIARPQPVAEPDPRRKRPQWRYVITDLANTPLGELTDITHDPVEDGVGDPATMQFTIATGGDQHALIKPVERQCQVWDGNVLRLRGPILPGQPSDDGSSITYKVHDPSWFWRDGRRVITRIPQKNLLRNGDFKSGLTWWTRGYDKGSKPAAAPNVRVVSEDFADDTDGLDPIKAAEIVGVESVTESELSSNAVFWPNLATFRPGGKAAIEKVADDMPNTAGLKVSIVGHTANDGTGNGLGLSKRRADAAAAIVHAKRPGAVITTKGVGFYDPKPGYPIDSQEQRRVVISYDQTITGESAQWMRQTVEVTQPKEARYNLTLTAAAMLKVMDDWNVPDANMVSVKITARRKSAPSKVWDETLGEGSASISDTDPIDRWIPQTAEATIPPDGRPYLVDVYLYAPAALARYTAVGLFPDEQLYFWGQDQALIFKGVMEHIQDPAFGHGDLGVLTRTPKTGVRRDREFAFRDLTPADTALDGLTAISRGLEWDTVTTATTTTATTFYPRQGKAVDYVLALGGNVAVAVPATTRDIGSNVIAQAQGLGSYRAVAYARDARVFGGTLLERVVTAEQDTPLNELRETAKAELYWARSSTPAYWVDIDPDSIADVLANTAKGDTVRLILDHPEPVDRLARIVRRQIHPDSLRLMVAFEEA